MSAAPDLRTPLSEASVPPAGGRRAPARFPLNSPSAPELTVLWCGDDATLARIVRDHVEAVGARLLEEPATAEAAAGPLLIGTVPTLERRLASLSATTPAGSPTLAVAPDGPVSDADWTTCLRLGVMALIRLPSESAHLLEHLGRRRRSPDGALLIGVAGGCGGAGASSMAARLAGAFARRPAPVVLLDADPLGGGIDLLVEAPVTTGGAWEDLGRLGIQDGSRLREGLPVVDGVSILAARGEDGPDPHRTAATLAALSPLDGVVIADLAAQHVPAALPHLDRLLLVVPATDHAVRSASRRLSRWEDARSRTGLLVRHGLLDAQDIAEDLGLPLIGRFRDSAPGRVPLLDVTRRGADRLAAQLAQRWEAPGWTR